MADLITLAEYKAYAGLNTPNQDNQILNTIPAAVVFAETYCNRKFVKFYDTADSQVFSASTYPLVLKNWPIVEVESVEISVDGGATYELFDGWVFNQEDDSIESTTGVPFRRLVNGYKVNYKHGYPELPADLKQALLELIKYYIRNDMAVHSNKAPGTNTVQLEWQVSARLPSHIGRVLDLYKVDYV